MITAARIGKAAPAFDLPSTRNLERLDRRVALDDYRGRWLVLLFYPLDFTFVCPTELIAFDERIEDFAREGADVLGVSVDSVFTHRAWMATPRDKGGIGELRYPLASDPTHVASHAYGVLLEEEGHTLRGTFIIDPDGVLRTASIHDNSVGRSVDETLRMLQALKTGELCPADWRPGRATLGGS